MWILFKMLNRCNFHIQLWSNQGPTFYEVEIPKHTTLITMEFDEPGLTYKLEFEVFRHKKAQRFD